MSCRRLPIAHQLGHRGSHNAVLSTHHLLYTVHNEASMWFVVWCRPCRWGSVCLRIPRPHLRPSSAQGLPWSTVDACSENAFGTVLSAALKRRSRRASQARHCVSRGLEVHLAARSFPFGRRRVDAIGGAVDMKDHRRPPWCRAPPFLAVSVYDPASTSRYAAVHAFGRDYCSRIVASCPMGLLHAAVGAIFAVSLRRRQRRNLAGGIRRSQ